MCYFFPFVSGTACIVTQFSEMMSDFTYWADLGVDPRLFCASCPCTMDDDWKPYTGRCGHTICEDCHHHKVVVAHPNSGEFQPCPVPACNFNQSFETMQQSNSAIIWLVKKTEELKIKINNYLCDIRMSQVKDLRERDETIKKLRNELALQKGNETNKTVAPVEEVRK